MATPTSAAARAGASFMPSPMCTTEPCLLRYTATYAACQSSSCCIRLHACYSQSNTTLTYNKLKGTQAQPLQCTPQGELTLVMRCRLHARLTASNLSYGNMLACTCSPSRPTAAATAAAAPGLSPVSIATTIPQLSSCCTAAAASGRGLSAKARYPASDPSMATQQIDAPIGEEHSTVNKGSTKQHGAKEQDLQTSKYSAVTHWC